MEKILRREINQLILEKQTIEKEVQTKEGLLEKARSGLEAAQQLSIQIEDKSRLITTLKSEGMKVFQNCLITKSLQLCACYSHSVA